MESDFIYAEISLVNSFQIPVTEADGTGESGRLLGSIYVHVHRQQIKKALSNKHWFVVPRYKYSVALGLCRGAVLPLVAKNPETLSWRHISDGDYQII